MDDEPRIRLLKPGVVWLLAIGEHGGVYCPKCGAHPGVLDGGTVCACGHGLDPAMRPAWGTS